MPEHTPIKTRQWLLVPCLVLGVSLLVTTAVAAYVWQSATAKDRARFENTTERAQAAIQNRLETYVNLLRGVAGFYAVETNKVTLKSYQTYIEQLRLADKYPGVQGIGVSGMSTEQKVGELVALMRSQGITNFEIYPPGKRDPYHAIIFLEPQDQRNRRAIGYDMSTEPVRRAAMELARDTGDPATSGKVRLVQEIDEQSQVGFLIYLPLYSVGVPATPEQRRKVIGGYIFSPFRVDDLFEGIFGSERSPAGISFSVYDGDRVTEEALLYRSEKSPDAARHDVRFAKTTAFNAPGRKWTVAFLSGPQFETNSSRGFAAIVLAAGGLVSVLLFTLTATQASARRRAEDAAQELRRGEQAIRLAHDEAERALVIAKRANELKDEFLATVSHELRTPLNSILGWSHVLSRGQTTDPEDTKHALDVIQQSAKTQQRLIEDLLDVSRIVTGNLRLDIRSISLASVIEGAIASVRFAAEAKNVRLQLELDPHIGTISGDEMRLQQIVWNLLSNAVKFTPAGGSVKVTLRRVNSDAHLIVADTGLGISRDFLPHVFERFRQADASTTRHHGGLGLGLGIVRQLTELHGGTVHAESPGPDMGSTFTVILPHATTSSSATATPSLSRKLDGLQLDGVHVLVVEDDDSARELIVRMLSDAGASVASCASVPSAIEAFHQHRPDVIVSDIGIPNQDGYTLIQHIRGLGPEAGGRVPAIAVTALARAEDRERALSAGFQRHLAKPFDPTELTAAVASLAVDFPDSRRA